MKIAIIGAGDVGAAAACRIAEADLADVVLLDIVKGKAKAKALDLSSASSIMGHSRTITGTTNYNAITGSDIVIVTAGLTRSPGQSREDLLAKNAKIVKEIAKEITTHCIGAIVIMVTNPVDVMSYLVHKVTGFSTTQIIGMSGTSDCARFNMLIANELNTDSRHIQSVIIGPHSDQMVVLPRFSTVLGIPVTELLPKARIDKIIEQTRTFGAKIVKLLGKGSAHFGPSAGIFLLVDSIVNDRKRILCASCYLSGQYGLKDICVGVPVKVGRLGLEGIIEIKLNKKEKTEFLSSIKGIRKLLKKLGV